MTDEQQLIECFRAMDGRAKSDLLNMAQFLKRSCPSGEPAVLDVKPELRLITGSKPSYPPQSDAQPSARRQLFRI
jgi:hypothetical protein